MSTCVHRLIICLCFTITSARLVSSFNYHAITGREVHVPEDSTESTTNLKSWRGQNLSNLYHQHRHLRTAQGILNIIGWGTLLPAGAIIARYFREFPMHWKEWYSCHVICQIGGYFLGTIGWFVGLLASGQHSDDVTHRILGIVIFIFTTIQMFAIFWMPKEEDEVYCCRKSWEIYHHFLGYALIALIIADIFQGIKHQNHATKWRWAYIGILAFLGLTAVSLEIFRWFKSKLIQRAVELNSSMYTSP